MTKDLPPLIDCFVAAVNRGDTEAFLACFAADWKGGFYSGPSRYVFVVEGGHIREMRITAA